MFLIVALSVAIHSCYIGARVVLSLFALHLGASQITIGVIAALYALVPLFFGVYLGRLSDTVGVRLPMLIGSALIGIAMMIGGVGHDLHALFVTALLMGAGFVLFNVSVQNLTGAHGPPEQRVRNFSILSIGYAISTFIGPVAAGFIIDRAGHAPAFFVFATFALLPIAVLLLRPSLAPASRAVPSEDKRSTLDLLRMPRVRKLVIRSGLIVAAWDLFGIYVPIYAHLIGLTATEIGIILGAYAAAAFLPRFTVPALLRRSSANRVLFVAMLVGAAGFAAFPLFRHVHLLMGIAAVIGLGLGCGQPLSMMMSYDRSPAGRTGEVTGPRLTANNLARVAIPVFAGMLGAEFGTSLVFRVIAANLVGISHLFRRSAPAA